MNKQLDLVTCTRYLDLVTCTRHLDLVICARYPDSSKNCRPQLSLISCRDFPQKATTPAKDEKHLSNLVVASENFVIGQIKLSSYFRKMRISLNIEAAPAVCRVAEVAWGHGRHPPKSLDLDKKFKPEHTLFCRELRFVAIYALFGDLWAKKVPFWVKNSVSWARSALLHGIYCIFH